MNFEIVSDVVMLEGSRPLGLEDHQKVKIFM